jgi:hypothetical protein
MNNPVPPIASGIHQIIARPRATRARVNATTGSVSARGGDSRKKTPQWMECPALIAGPSAGNAKTTQPER